MFPLVTVCEREKSRTHVCVPLTAFFSSQPGPKVTRLRKHLSCRLFEVFERLVTCATPPLLSVCSDQTLACFLESSSTSAQTPILSGLTYFWPLIVSIFAINPLTIPSGRVYQQSAGESIRRKDISSTYTPEQTQLGNCLFFPRGWRRTET